MQVEQRMEQLPRASVGLRAGIGWERMFKQGNIVMRIGPISILALGARGARLVADE
jgi:hypothetical protein